ncbi:TIGR02281 family clan AA aspartic protease [Alsobacter soli]|uniref:TIGR02281 family clan AA aspartic protease n=1 Tax=Alsobacter soli TaxID=2109933 RepID=A0A2T1HPV5_9HYPH|nr:TIGR02281 family clan AA aspartic protease [Alsobacter soli]PSC03539.1 TIGR02281 family clan AA aspartic protease [Alsobacter soli]
MLKIAGAVAFIGAACVVAAKFADGLPAARSSAPASTGPVVMAAASAPAPLPPSRSSYGRPTVVLLADPRGHYQAEPQINGAKIRTLVDTGASVVALSAEDARRAGIFPAGADYRIPVGTANGTVKAAPVTLREVRLDAIVLRDVEAMVLPEGRLQGTLLGMSFLRRLGMEVAQGRLVLTQ